MISSHSSLLADTGLSEISLDKLGIHSVEREDYDPEMIYLIRKGLKNPLIIIILSSTLHPFKHQPWYEDEDVIAMLQIEGMETNLSIRPRDIKSGSTRSRH